MKNYLIALTCILTLAAPAFAQTEDDVGDLASFRTEAKFMGYASSGVVMVRRNCTGTPLGPDDRCVPIDSVTNSARFDERNLGRIKFPPKTFENIIYLLSRHQLAYTFLNTSTANKSGRVQYTPYTTLISSVLNDPSLINTQTGQPFNGRVDIASAGSRSLIKTLFPNYHENDVVTYGSPSISGITAKFLSTNYGLPQSVVEEMFRNEITIELNMLGQTNNVEQASFLFRVRFTGN